MSTRKRLICSLESSMYICFLIIWVTGKPVHRASGKR